MNALPNVRPSGDEMFVGECGDGNAGEKSGRDRTREVVYKLGVHVYAIISQQAGIYLGNFTYEMNLSSSVIRWFRPHVEPEKCLK